MSFFKRNALLALATVGLMYGSTARAVERGVEQSEPILYSVTVIDVGEDGTGNSLTGLTPVVGTTKKVRVKVTVSIPRTGPTYSVPARAVPARLMARPHSGEKTAFDGSIYLSPDAPYGTEGASVAYKFYPMPQSTSVPNMTAISSGTAESTYASYVIEGEAHDPARWEATYLSRVFDVDTAGTTDNALVTSLLKNDAAYEWYVAARYGLSSATRVSDIQDHGRKMTFLDKRLWEPVIVANPDPDDSKLVGPEDASILGSTFEWRLRTLSDWHIYRGTIGSTSMGQPGLQLLNVKGDSAEFSDYPRVESPLYPSGIQSISFEAFAPDPTPDVDDPQIVLVQCKSARTNNTWEEIARVTVSTSPKTYTVNFDDKATVGSMPRFRLVRFAPLESGGQMSELVMTIRNVLVRSAAPGASVGAPRFLSEDSSAIQPNALESFKVQFPLLHQDTKATPRGYEATMKVRRRAAGDTNAAWHVTTPATLALDKNNPNNGTATVSFEPGTLLPNEDGSTNALEDAFFQNMEKQVTGMLPGVYDLMLDYNVLGSFAAGREIIDQREKVHGEATTYEIETTAADGSTTTLIKPNVLEVREQQTVHSRVFARVQYRSGIADEYQLKTLDIPLLPSAHTPNKWRVDVSRVLRLADDDTEIYAWGYDNPDEEGDERFTTNMLSFKLYAEQEGEDPVVYGQAGSDVPGVMPRVVAAVPALTDTLQKDGASIVVSLDGLPNSHVMLEVEFTDIEHPLIRIGGSYWQDFNTWYAPSMNFTTTEFREDVNSVVADFNCTVNPDTGIRLEGWIPDEGPLASTTSFVDRFEVFRGATDDSWPLSLTNDDDIARVRFASWGASHEAATPNLLNAKQISSGVYRTEYVKLDAGVEVVLTRDWTVTEGGSYRPDAQLRLREQGQEIVPRSDGLQNVVLQGVGHVSFTVGRSIPYDRTKMAILSPDSLTYLSNYGFSAGVQLESPATTCAASGYSVSYYLIDLTQTLVFYELRVTQILQYTTSPDQEPIPTAVMELYKWVDTEATRQSLVVGGNTKEYHSVAQTLNGYTFAMRVSKDGKIHVGAANGVNGVPQEVFVTKDAVAPTGDNKYGFAVCSAECLPTFRNVSQITSADSFGNPQAIANVKIVRGVEARPWSVTTDSTATLLRRTAPSADDGAIIVSAVRLGTDEAIREEFMTVVRTGETFSKALGATNAQLEIRPANKHTSVFIDNLSVSSWNGNDTVRNGTYVPKATDAGFSDDTGFAGVGVWVQPKSSQELTLPAAQYSGEQILLMQRSRMNATVDQPGADENGETTLPDNSVRHTGNRLALYSPSSQAGFGAVTFRYRVPTRNEFTTDGKMAPVYVMLQHTTTPSANYLTTQPENWKNVSQPIELPATGDEWAVASITPRFTDTNEELVGTKGAGALRLVLVTTDLASTADPYVYIDDFTITDNREGTLASWSAENVKLTDDPIKQLYWKDRLAGTVPEGYAPEETFAEKSVLTRALQFNDVMSGPGVDDTYAVSELTSPELLAGAGRLSFAARLADGETTPTRLYIYAEEENSKMRPLTYVDVATTVYQSFDIDLSKFSRYQTGWTEEGLPDTVNAVGDNFNPSNVRRLQLRVFLEKDGNTNDGFNKAPTYARVLIDQLAIADPIRPSLRVAGVSFSNILGEQLPELFDRSSPLSQPVANAPALRAMVQLDQVQLLDPESIRVFLTLDPHEPGAGNLDVVKDAQISYTDVLNRSISANENSPIYRWNPSKAEQWSLASWFDLASVEKAVSEHGGEDDADDFFDALPDALKATTVELTPKKDGDLIFYNDDLTVLTFNGKKLTDLAVNSLVRYNAWVVYQSNESESWHVSQIEPQHYTELPWYFPRSMNREIQTQLAVDGALDSTIFSPYYWVYSTTPGEVFVNEINAGDTKDAAPSMASFYEICAPVGVDIKGWRLAETREGTTDIKSTLYVGKNATSVVLPTPDPGAVPMRGVINTLSNRSFYTLFGNQATQLYYMDGTTKYTETTTETTPEEAPQTRTYRNAGMAQDNDWIAYLQTTNAASISLYRPTGGAEHIVVYSEASELNAENAMKRVTELYESYQQAYVAQGFGGEWYQAFFDADWEQESTEFGPIGGYKSDDLAKLHARRLAKVDSFPSRDGGRYDPNGTDTTYGNDRSDTYVGSSPVVNSIATVDMGGFWVTRKNALVTDAEDGPVDLTILLTGTWPSTLNPVKTPRKKELLTAGDPLIPGVQVTPRQINPDQYLLPYTGLDQSMVTSTLDGMGMHTLTLLQKDEATGALVDGSTLNAGRNSPNMWPVSADYLKARLTYTALPFHAITSVSIRMTNCETGATITNPEDLIPEMAGQTPDAEGWVTIDYTSAASLPEVAEFVLTVGDETTTELRYNVEAKATFSLVAKLAKGVIERVATYCGTTLPSQPWWGSSFGFEVGFDPAKADGATLSSVFVTYPSAETLATIDIATTTLDAAWTGATLTLDGKSPEEVRTLLGENGLRYVELTNPTLVQDPDDPDNPNARKGILQDSTVMGILSDTYARAMGYNPDDATTYADKEPAIPFCVWGVYTFTVQSDKGSERISFVLRQDDLATTPSFTVPTWYQPLAPASTKVPYFYLYSTPPESAWLSEVNLVAGTDTGSAAYAEVVLPKLRNGIVDAGVPATSVQGWNIRAYDATGTQVGTVAVEDGAAYASASYNYYLANGIPTPAAANTAYAYTLIRPCGAAEGGVWTAVDADGDTPVAVPTATETNPWLFAPNTYYVVPGVTDSNTVAGSVQLIGQTETRAEYGIPMISSSIAKRTVWKFAAESPKKDNEGIPPDIVPTWNRVTMISTLRNTVYGGTLCGYQRVPGLFDTADAAGTASTEGAITVSLSGTDWVYSATNPRVLSYRPRANYRFEQLTLPKDLIGKVMLVGKDQFLTAAELDAEVTRLKALVATNPQAPFEEWIQMGRDGTGATRAKAETRTYPDTDGDGNPEVEYTGVITFNPDFLETPIGAEEPITFGDLDSFVVTLVFVEEPRSAENPIEMAMGQGDIKTGAWLVTQTFYAIDPETDTPVETKGGIALEKPIWSDEDGNADGDYKDLHGWLYQPTTGDKRMGMTTVLNPELGLLNGLFAGGTLESVRDALEGAKADSGTVRPMLVWTLIEKSKVPTDLFASAPTSKEFTAFLDGWDLMKWLGGAPSIGDGTTLDLAKLRQTLKANVGTVGSLYAQAGIVPMVYNGYCGVDPDTAASILVTPDYEDPENPGAALPERTKDTLLSFRTMTPTEWASALDNESTKLHNSDGLLPYSDAIDMVDANGAEWTEGSILRFAIILVDTSTNVIYDCQSISNFSSEKSDAYCPWYLPDEKTNINTLAKRREKGVSPYAWIYNIPVGNVWLNEARPFAQGDGEEGGARAYSALELAMYASPLDETTKQPKFSLDGWQVVTKIAIMPHATAALENQIVWTELQRVPLLSWVPYRRIKPEEGNNTTNPAYYDLDYYGMTTSADSGFGNNETGTFTDMSYPEVGVDSFCWLKLSRELFGAEDDDAIDALMATNPTTVPYATMSSGKYGESDVLYAISLERGNGVVVDEVLFYRVANSRDYYDNTYTMNRMRRAVEMENAHDCVVNEVRGFTIGPAPADLRTLQFLKNRDTGALLWSHSSSSGAEANLITLVGMNYLGSLVQPYLEIDDQFLPSITFYLSGQVNGAPGDLTVTNLAGQKIVGSHPSVSTNLMRGAEYRLLLSGANFDWYTQPTVTKNGAAHTPPMTSITTYALNSASVLAATNAHLIDESTLEKNTDYTLTFSFISDAARELAEESEEPDYLDWLLESTPDEIQDQQEAGETMTPAEKYWLGFESATEEADVALTFTKVETHQEPDETEVPLVAISFTKTNDEGTPEPITEIKEDGRLLLLGRETLEEDWKLVQILGIDDVNGDNELILLETTCKFFKAILLSKKEAEAYPEE